MTLAIVNSGTMYGTLDIFVVSPEMLNAAATHLFISANSWDKVIVEICPEIRADKLKYVQLGDTPVEVILHDNLEQNEVSCLAYLFPDKAGAIRRAYMAQRPMSEVIPNVWSN